MTNEQRKAEIEDLTSRIRDTQKKLKEQIDTFPGLAELEAQIQKSEKQLEQLRKEIDVGRRAPKDFDDAEQKLTELKIQLSDRKAKSVNNYNDDIDGLNRQVASLSSQININMKLAEKYNEQLESARKKLEKSDEYEVLSIKSDIAKTSLKKALENLADLKRNADIVPPTITVMGD